MSSKNKVLLCVAVLLGSLFLFGLSKQIHDALESGKRLDVAVEQVNKLQETNRMLEKRLEKVKSYDFIEEVARNKLNLVRDGETVVIIDQKSLENVLAQGKTAPVSKIPNWQGWLKLFLH